MDASEAPVDDGRSRGGQETKPNGDGVTVIASVAVIVSFDMERTDVK